MDSFLNQYKSNTRKNYHSRLNRLSAWIGGFDNLADTATVINIIEKNVSPSSCEQYLATAKAFSIFNKYDKQDEYTTAIQKWRGVKFPRQIGGIDEDADLAILVKTIKNLNTRKNYKSRARIILELADVPKISLLSGKIKKTTHSIQNSTKSSETKKALLVVLARIVDKFDFENREIVTDAMEEASELVSQERKTNPIRGTDKYNWNDVILAVKTNWNNLDNRGKLLLAVYTGMPPLRGEWATVHILDTGDNYINFNKEQLVLRKFKNVKQMGEKKLDIPIWILNLINIFKKPNQEYVFEKSSGGSYSQGSFLLLLKGYLKQIGTPMGVHDLRRKYETLLQSTDEYNNLSDAMRERIHEELLHTKETAMSYREVKKSKQNSNQINALKRKSLFEPTL